MGKKILTKINVLIPEAGGAVAMAIMECLRMTGKYRIITSDITSEIIGIFRGDVGYEIPRRWDLYDEIINKIINKEKIEIIIPSHDIALSHFVKSDYNIPILIDPKMVSIAQNKYKTAEWLRKNKFLFPKTWKEIEKVEEFPVIIKPISGIGSSKGVYKANNEKELQYFIELCKRDGWNPIIQEYLRGQEYTNMAYISRDGEVLTTTVSLTTEKKMGLSFKLVVLKENYINEEVRKIAEKLRVSGPVNMQGIETENGFTVFEFNARFSGSEATRAYAGVNGPDILIRNWLYDIKEYPKIKKSIRAFFYRSYAYIDYEKWKELKRKKKYPRIGDFPHWL